MSRSVMPRLLSEAETIRNLYEQGASFQDLAVRFGCAHNTIRRFLVSQNTRLRKPLSSHRLDAVHAELLRALQDGDDIGAIARRHRVRRETLVRYLIAKSGVMY